jgi:hypothetical protein
MFIAHEKHILFGQKKASIRFYLRKVTAFYFLHNAFFVLFLKNYVFIAKKPKMQYY